MDPWRLPPAEAALFAADTADGGSTVFFSPEAVEAFADVLGHYDAEACPKPKKRHVSLLMGIGEATELLFPDADEMDD